MKSLVHGCAAAALLCGLAAQAHAEIRVQDAPVHAVPVDEEDGVAGPSVAAAEAPPVKAKLDVTKTAAEPADIARAEPAAVKALIAPKAPQQPALTPDETAFFTVLGTRVTDAASAYETYVRRTTAIDPAFSGAGSVQKAVTASAAYQPHQLEEGIVAYAALVALRNPAFVEGVRAMDPRFFEGLSASPGRVMQVRGSYEAAADVAGVLRAQGESLTAAGKAITKAAYDIQAQSWSKNPVADPQAVLAEAKASAEAPRVATLSSKEKLLASLVTAPQAQTGAGLGAPDVVRGLALAAMAITGHTGDGREAEYEGLLRDASSADCLKMAKMNLAQCLAVAGPHYEDVYCAGRHAVSDTGKCVTAAAAGGPADAVAQPVAAPPVAAPRIETAEIGREQAAAYGHPTPRETEDDDDAVTAPSIQAANALPPAAPAPIQRTQPQYQPPQSYARNDYAPPPQQYAQPQAQYAQPEYNPPQYQPQAQPQYQQPQYQPPQYQQPQAQYPQQQTYQQPYAPPQQQAYPQPQYQHQQPYRQPQQAYGYSNPQPQQPYYPQQQQQSYYGR